VLDVLHCQAPPMGDVAKGTQEQSVTVVGPCDLHRSGPKDPSHVAPFSTAQSVTLSDSGMHSSVLSKVWLPAGQGCCRPSAVQGGYAARPVVSLQQVDTVRAQVSGGQVEIFTFPSAQTTLANPSQYADSG
jgi:hypothetical protein